MSLMSRAVATAAIAIGTMAIAGPAHAAFAVSNTGGGDGYVTPTATNFDLFGADNSCGGSYNCSTLYTTVASAAGTYSFSYVYTTADLTGLGVADPAGFILDGVRTQLSQDLSATNAGTATITFAAGDTYGFYVDTDGLLGRGNILVTPTPTTPAVPEPASWAMMIAGFGLVGGALRSRKVSRHVFG